MNWNNLKKQKKFFRFLRRSLLFFCILFFLDYSIGSLLKYLYFKQGSGSLNSITFALDSTKADIIIIGSSTANHHYYPTAFEDKLKMSYYNTGQDGTTILYHYAMLVSILKRYSPKIVILDVDFGEFEKDQNSYDRLSILLPYYHNHPELRPIIKSRSPYEKIKLLSKIYPFNSMVFSVIIRNSYFNEYNLKRKEDDKGYIPLNRSWNKPIQMDTDSAKYELDNYKIDLFKSFIKECIESNVTLYAVTSAQFILQHTKDTSLIIAKKITSKFNIPFYNYAGDTSFWKHPEYFADRLHLNNTGAEIFSNKVVEKIIQNQKDTMTTVNKSFSKIKEDNL